MGEPVPEENPLNIDGELSIRNLDELHKLFVDAIDQDADLAIDFAKAEACDTAALQLIISLRKTSIQRGRRFRIVALSPVIQQAAAALGIPIEELTGTHEDSAVNDSSASGGAGVGV